MIYYSNYELLYYHISYFVSSKGQFLLFCYFDKLNSLKIKRVPFYNLFTCLHIYTWHKFIQMFIQFKTKSVQDLITTPVRKLFSQSMPFRRIIRIQMLQIQIVTAKQMVC